MVTIISPSVFLSKCESRLRDERAPKDPEDTSFAHAVSGNSLHNFVLKNLFVYNNPAVVSVERPATAWAEIHSRDASTCAYPGSAGTRATLCKTGPKRFFKKMTFLCLKIKLYHYLSLK